MGNGLRFKREEVGIFDAENDDLNNIGIVTFRKDLIFIDI